MQKVRKPQPDSSAATDVPAASSSAAQGNEHAFAGSEPSEQSTVANPASSASSTAASAATASGAPNVHVQRLQAVGDFFTSMFMPAPQSSTGAAARSGTQTPTVPSATSTGERKRRATNLHVLESFIQGSPSPGKRITPPAATQTLQSATPAAVAAAHERSQSANAAHAPSFTPSTSAAAGTPRAAAASIAQQAARSQASQSTVPPAGQGQVHVSTSVAAAADSVAAPERPAYLPAAGIVVEQMFENERRQPIRGWGHTWPGHFLPTDPVGHWCNAAGECINRGTSFAENAPATPKGWAWCALVMIQCFQRYDR